MTHQEMASNLGGTVADGIKDVSALLPLLGTEQCEEHVGSALVGGFLYAAVAPLSLFGSLGIARAGGKALMACIRIRTFMGAKLLRDAGFAPVGKALSQIMWDGERHVAEKQLTEMLEKLHITDMEKLSVEENRRNWNLRLLCCLLPVAVASTMPYIYFIRNDHTDAKLDAIVKRDNINPPDWWDAKNSSEVTLYQLFAKKYRGVPGSEAEKLWKALEHSLTKADKTLKAQLNVSQQNQDPEAGTPALPNHPVVQEKYRPFTTPSYFHWLSIVGYIGSFTIVSNDGKTNTNSKGPLIWLGAEIALSLLRMLIWSLNPPFDENTGLTFKLKLEAGDPLPTCNKFSEELEANGVIPLARSAEFLGQITSFVGLLEPFESVDDGVALYYTMSAQREPTPTEQEPAPTKQQRVLYITIYEYTENITHSFTLVYLPSSNQAKTCYNSRIEVEDSDDNVKSDSEDNVGRLCARLRGKVSMASNHITNDKPFIKKLEKHCASIFSKLHNRANLKRPDMYTKITRTWALTEPPKGPEPGVKSGSPPSVDELAYLRDLGAPERAAAKFLMLYEWQFLEHMLVYESRELEIILLSSSKTMILRLQQRPEGRNLDALGKEQISEAIRRVKDEQAHANRRLHQLDGEVRSWITEYWGLTEDSLEACTQMFSNPIQLLWEQLIDDMEGNKENALEENSCPPALPESEYDDFLTKTLATLSDALEKSNSPTEKWDAKRTQRDDMTGQLREDVQTMGKWLELFIPAVQVVVEQREVLHAYDDVRNGCTDFGSGAQQRHIPLNILFYVSRVTLKNGCMKNSYKVLIRSHVPLPAEVALVKTSPSTWTLPTSLAHFALTMSTIEYYYGDLATSSSQQRVGQGAAITLLQWAPYCAEFSDTRAVTPGLHLKAS
ncbi:hypothetical protein PLEOSDRAFT_1081735 [Pleurotus ostreatus PC15]|uniref:Uncharacterized protein n=1 Tax=Pleurotus ostreatus (strain PC15) TaxID=1137138 RepID=A0A067P169_PLEO1|nr:hypothetical protein PLEOSDRAFT_1081735 [Pleurotus ostreatus PC15]